MIRQNDFIDDAARISVAQTRIAGGDECAGTLRMQPAHNIAMDRSESDTVGETGEFQAREWRLKGRPFKARAAASVRTCVTCFKDE